MEDGSIELELAMAAIPYPSVDAAGVLHDGLWVVQPQICIKCKDKECAILHAAEWRDQVAHCTCKKGMSVMTFAFSFGRIVANGLIEMSLNNQASPQVKKQNRSQKVRFTMAQTWYRSVCSAGIAAQSSIEKRISEGIQSLHDIGTAVRLVRSCASRIVNQYPGRSDDEKIESAPPEMKALFKSVLLLGRRLDMSSILANPEAASFGQKRPTPVYKIFDLLCRLHRELAHLDGGKHINLDTVASSQE
jgi:hypothetical protein